MKPEAAPTDLRLHRLALRLREAIPPPAPKPPRKPRVKKPRTRKSSTA